MNNAANELPNTIGGWRKSRCERKCLENPAPLVSEWFKTFALQPILQFTYFDDKEANGFALMEQTFHGNSTLVG
jgi:hypothetical protein